MYRIRFRRFPRLFVGFLFAVAATTGFIPPARLIAADQPLWWKNRGVVDPTKPRNDFAVINQGQLKTFTKAAIAEMDQHLAGGAGQPLHDLLASWAVPTSTTADYAVTNVGQLKTIGWRLYDGLISAGTATSYPWSVTVADDSDWGIANIGQAKTLFAFDVDPRPTLVAKAAAAIDSRLLPGKDINVFDNFQSNPQPPAYVRNANCWAADLDLTSVSVWTGRYYHQYGATLISPRHVLSSAHLPVPDEVNYHAPEWPEGAHIRFVNRNNQIVERTVKKAKLADPNNRFYPDLAVGILDQEINPPDGIGIVKVLPSNWNRCLQRLNPDDLPALAFNQQNWAMVRNVSYLTVFAGFSQPTSAPRANYYGTDVVPGDSSHPAFIILDRNVVINGMTEVEHQMVLLTVWTHGGAGDGTFVSSHIDRVNQLMDELSVEFGDGNHYQLIIADLSGFKGY